METSDLQAAIRAMTDYGGYTLREIEETLKMPHNCLSAMVNGTRNMGPKWKCLLVAFVEAKQKGATSIVIPIGPAKVRETIQEKKTKAIPAQKERIKEPEIGRTPPPGLSKAQQIRWHREHNQTLQ